MAEGEFYSAAGKSIGMTFASLEEAENQLLFTARHIWDREHKAEQLDAGCKPPAAVVHLVQPTEGDA
jgi:hypothetical protein